MGEATIGIRTTSPAFGGWLDRVLGAYRSDGSAEPEYSVVVDDTDGGGRRFNVLYQGVGVVARSLDPRAIARSLLSELEARMLRSREDGVYVHYGLARSGALGVVVPAWLVSYLAGTGRHPSRAGISLPLARWVRLDDEGIAVPSGRVLDVPADAFETVPGPIQTVVDATYDDLDAPRGIDAVVTYVEELDTIAGGTRGRALYHLAERTANLGALGGGALDVLGRLVERAHCFETGLGRPQQMLGALRAVFEHERAHAPVGGVR